MTIWDEADILVEHVKGNSMCNYAMQREIARENEVTSVEYVRYRSIRYTIGRLRPHIAHNTYYNVYHTHKGCNRLKRPVSFYGWFDTHGVVYNF